MTGFRVNLRVIAWAAPLMWGSTLVLAAYALGYDVLGGHESVYSLVLRSTWPIGLPIAGLFSIRITRLFLPWVDAVSLSSDAMVLRTEPVRIRDRRIRRTEVAGMRTTTSKHGEQLYINLVSGAQRGVNLKLIRDPEAFVAAIDVQWPEHKVRRAARPAPSGSASS